MTCSSDGTRRRVRRRSAGMHARRRQAVQHRGAPHRKRKTLPSSPTWTCPHCQHVHTAATLMRLDSETLQCEASVSEACENQCHGRISLRTMLQPETIIPLCACSNTLGGNGSPYPGNDGTKFSILQVAFVRIGNSA